MDSYIGSITIFAFNWAPMSWALCNGALLQIVQNQPLYALIGTTYGGDGRTNFNLPNLCGRAPVSLGTLQGGGSYVVGQQFGCEQMALSQNQLPAHTHTVAINASDAQATAMKPTSNYWAKGYASAQVPQVANYTNTKNVTMASDAVTVSTVGGGAQFSMAQPSLVLNFAICLSGLFPVRP